MSKNVVFMGVVGWNCFLSSRWCLYSLTKRMLNYSFNSPLFHLSLSRSLFLSLSLCLEIGAIWLAGPSRNKRCEAGLGEGVAVFYEPLKFYSSLHRGSLRPRGRHALNKLSSFLHPLRPNICLPSPLTRSPPNPSTHRLNGLFIVWCSSPTSSFFPSLCVSPSTCVQWCGGLTHVVRPHVCPSCGFVLRECVSPCLCERYIRAVCL